jgi:hypothetical protein
MSEAESAPLPALREAPGWRRTLARLVDMATVAGVMYARRRMTGRRLIDAGPSVAPSAARKALGELLWPTALLERVGTPGERLLGVRTVDRRSGRPVALGRAVALTATAAAITALRTRLAPPPVTDEDRRLQQELMREVDELKRRHGDDPDAFNAAMAKLWEKRKGATRNTVGPFLAINLGLSLLVRRLQRRIAPTVVVMRRPPVVEK